MNSTSVKIFAENVEEVRALFQLRATCRWLKQVCDERLVVIKPSVPADSNLLSDIESANASNLLHYPHLPCVANAAIKKATPRCVETFVIHRGREFGERVASPTTVRLVMDKVGGSTALFLVSRDGRLGEGCMNLVRGAGTNPNVAVLAELFNTWYYAFSKASRDVNLRIARMGLGLHSMIASPFKQLDIVEELLDSVVLPAWKREDGSKLFVPLEKVLGKPYTRRIAKAFSDANPEAFLAYMDRRRRSDV